MTRDPITRGFTLVEMLLVISLIALLIALLLPALQKSKSSARAAVCLVNLRQLHTAQQLYADEYFGKVKPLSHALGGYWHHALARYLGDSNYHLNPNQGQWKQEPLKVFACPEALNDPVGGFGTADRVWHWGGGGQGGYGANLWLFTRYNEYDFDFRFPRKHFFSSFMDVDRTSSVPLFGDSNWVGSWPDSVDTVPPSLHLGWAVHEIGYFMGRFSITRHDRSVQLVFVDSSARRVPLAELWQQRWHRGFAPVEKTVP
ncbi:MAG: prepilin-type N-terminal cleavage/methylation domain-containing protein [Phycisphaeraceae bacterium]